MASCRPSRLTRMRRGLKRSGNRIRTIRLCEVERLKPGPAVPGGFARRPPRESGGHQMQRPNVIVVQGNTEAAALLAASLQKHCRSVYVASSPAEARAAVPKHRADVLIADLELMRLPEIERLHSE